MTSPSFKNLLSRSLLILAAGASLRVLVTHEAFAHFSVREGLHCTSHPAGYPNCCSTYSWGECPPGVNPPIKKGFKVCNYSGYLKAQVAYGYHSGAYWWAKGWYTIPQGDCKVVDSRELRNRYYYIHAKSIDSRYAVKDWSTGKADIASFCVLSSAFDIPDSNVCQERSENFVKIDVRDAKGHTLQLR